jgi:membrane-anchored protein YejM (alkaline phosphatase superfamily)
MIIFLAFTSATLLFNAVIIWYAYKAFFKVTFKVTETLQELQARESTKIWLSALETASTHAVALTDQAKTQLANFDPVLARAHSKYEFRLAQIDVQMEKGINKIRDKTESLQNSLVQPAHRLGATLAGVFEMINYFGGEQFEGDDDETALQQSDPEPPASY